MATTWLTEPADPPFISSGANAIRSERSGLGLTVHDLFYVTNRRGCLSSWDLRA